MKPLIGIVIILLSILAAHPGFSQDQAESREDVAVQGSGTIYSRNVAKARSTAIENALLEAVLQTTRDLLGEGSFNRNRDLLKHLLKTKTRRLVKDFRIVKERRLDNSVTIELVARAEEERVRDELENWGILYERGRRPQLGLVNLDTGTDTRSQRLSSQFIQKLIGLGYNVSKIENETQGDTLSNASDLTFMGSIRYDKNKNILLDLKVHLSGNQSKSRVVKGRIERPKTSDGNSSQIQIGMAAVRFLRTALPLWISKTGRGNHYMVDFVGLPSSKEYDALLKFFGSKANGFRGAREKRFSRGKVLFAVFYSGQPADLVRRVESKMFANTKFELSERSGRDLVFRVK